MREIDRLREWGRKLALEYRRAMESRDLDSALAVLDMAAQLEKAIAELEGRSDERPPDADGH